MDSEQFLTDKGIWNYADTVNISRGSLKNYLDEFKNYHTYSLTTRVSELERENEFLKQKVQTRTTLLNNGVNDIEKLESELSLLKEELSKKDGDKDIFALKFGEWLDRNYTLIIDNEDGVEEVYQVFKTETTKTTQETPNK